MTDNKTNNTCDKIVKNALILFNEKGYDGASISDIASATGVSKGIMYHYFKNKDALYLYCVKNFIDTAYEHISKQKMTDNDINKLVVRIVNFGGFFESNPHFEYIFINMMTEKPTHLSSQLHEYSMEFKENNRKYFTKLIESVDLGAGVSSCDVENFLFMIQNAGNSTISALMSENPYDSQLDIMARMIKIFLQGLKKDLA